MQQEFIPTNGSTHLNARLVYNANAVDAETRISGLEASVSGLGTMATESSGDYARISHSHTITDLNSEIAPSGYVATADGSGNTTWEEAQGGSSFSLVTVTTPTYTQIPEHTHHLYDDTDLDSGGTGSGSGGAGPCMVVDLLDPTLHESVTVHKKIGNNCDILLLPPSGCTIDGIVSDGLVSGYTLSSQYESISIFSDGVSGYYIQ